MPPLLGCDTDTKGQGTLRLHCTCYLIDVMVICMDMNALEARKGSRKQLQIAERNVLIAKMVDLLGEGWISSGKLAKQLRVNRATIESYRPLVDEIISKTKIDRNVIRNLQLKRTYLLIEKLMEDLNAARDLKEKSLIYNSIYKFSSHLALITGLNVETHVNIDPTKLVIIRANQKKQTDRVIDAVPDHEEVAKEE